MNSGSRQQAYFDKDQPPITHRSLDNPAQERGVSKNWQESKVGKAEQSVSTGKLEAALKKMSKQATQYEFQMKELERNFKRADQSLHLQIPAIEASLDESVDTLSELTQTLPKIRTQVQDIRVVYDSGREKDSVVLIERTDTSWSGESG
ncbi:hypothetical protein HHX47_DHR6000293 [Lentinula edodes]|nr:hypothetical protein HHX47_DHR6000293 [Lentinula edodes]